jgi:phosphoribosylaminoimidazole-succinocarboxamide synthase
VSGFGIAGPPPAPAITGWTHLRTGKVRDLYTNESGNLLIVASDRVSAFDWVLPTLIPNKGAVLTQLSLWWFAQLKHLVPSHIISTDVPIEVAGRAVIAAPLNMYPIECVARGYLTGSGWAEYKNEGRVCGNDLPAGLQDGSKLERSIFTPATKAQVGDHDINIDFLKTTEIIGAETAGELRDLTLEIYDFAANITKERGILLADTKFEFGTNPQGEIILGDEVLTPDSSRFWSAPDWQPGSVQPSFDKQFLRDHLLASGWDRNSAPPELPAEIIEKTSERYLTAFELITSTKFTK